jgi:hypothetical protein
LVAKAPSIEDVPDLTVEEWGADVAIWRKRDTSAT